MQERKTPKAAATRTTILEMALSLFCKNGYDNVGMKDIAKAAGVSVGASYYYFRSKDELVLAYYQSTQEESEDRNRRTIEQTRNFRERICDIVDFKFQQLERQRPFLSVLATHAATPNSPLSPFSNESKDIRDRAVEIFEQSIEGSDLIIAPKLRHYFAGLMWLYHMGLIFYWLHDNSINQKKTKKIFHLSLDVILRLAAMSRLPLMTALNRKMYQLLDLLLPKAGLAVVQN